MDNTNTVCRKCETVFDSFENRQCPLCRTSIPDKTGHENGLKTVIRKPRVSGFPFGSKKSHTPRFIVVNA